jgi:hypothetical protein
MISRVGALVFWASLAGWRLLGGQAQGAQTAYWDFGASTSSYTEGVTKENVAGTPTLVVAGAGYDDNGKDGVIYTDSTGEAHDAGQGGAWSNVNNSPPAPEIESQMIITLSTVGWVDLAIRWDYNSQSTPVDDLGPVTFDMDYRVNVTAGWQNIVNNQTMVRDGGWHVFSMNLFAIAAVENKPKVEFRINDIKGADESGGDFKIDNVEITGTQLPSSLTVVHPNGNIAQADDHELIAGSRYWIEWSWTGTVSDVVIDYSLDGGSTWVKVGTVGNTGFYEWEIPDANSFGGLVRVTNADNLGVWDVSNGPLRIYRCGVMFDANGDCLVDMRDLAVLAMEWLVCGKPSDLACE